MSFSPHSLLRAVWVLFLPMASRWVGEWREKACPGCISETMWCRMLMLGRDIGWVVLVFKFMGCDLNLTFYLAVVIFDFENLL